MEKFFLIHYSEIALKGKNRAFFENKLKENIILALPPSFRGKVRKITGRILIDLGKKELEDFEKIKEKLKKVFGIAYFALSYKVDQEIDKLSQDLLSLIKNLKLNEKKLSFKVFTKRSNKKYPYTSEEINQKVGAFLLSSLPQWHVDLKNPKLTIYLEIVEDKAFVYFEKIKGYGGLPVGVSGKIVSLISSGFDSPLSAWLLMKRGARIIFVHFHSYPSTSLASKENVEELVKFLTEYQLSSKLYFIPFLKIQKEIVKIVRPSYRVLLYRWLMLKIAEKIAQREQAQALATGESLGQVASQTIENIKVLSQATDLPILRPLIEYNKEEIIDLAKKLGTYEISSRPYEDCCSLFVPRHPETKADLKKIKKFERKLNVKRLIKRALQEKEIKIIKSYVPQ